MRKKTVLPEKVPSTAKRLTPENVREAIGHLLHWAAAYCAYENETREGEPYRLAQTLRTGALLLEIVQRVAAHEATWDRRVREARVADLVPDIAKALAKVSRQPTSEELNLLRAEIEALFGAKKVFIMRSKVTALAKLAERPSDLYERQDVRQRSVKDVENGLHRAGVVNCSAATIENYRLAKTSGKVRKGAAVRTNLGYDALVAAKRVRPEVVLRLALESISGVSSGPLVEMPLQAWEEATSKQPAVRREWF
jgi:hypothetical protein